jgi:hypothetical protein
MSFQIDSSAFTGPGGTLVIHKDDEVSRRIAMLIEGECGAEGPSAAARMFGFCRQRYFQLRTRFGQRGAQGLIPRPPGPKRNYRRTDEVVCQVIRHRFLDPEAGADVIAQKLQQAGFAVSARSVERVFAEFGLQKKTLSVSARPEAAGGTGHVPDPEQKPPGAGRPRQSGTRRKGTSRG